MSRISALYRLQQIDSESDQRQAKLAELEAQLAKSPALQQAQAALTAAQQALTEARRKAKALDDENKSLTAKIKTEEERLYGGRVKNPRELSDLQSEITALKQKRETLDEAQLGAMEEVEGAEQLAAAAQAHLAKVETARAVEIEELIQTRDQLQALLANLQENRASAVRTTAPDDLLVYEALRKRRRGIAVVTLADSTCKGCGEAQSSSKVQMARQEIELVRCANCERILYAGQDAHYSTLEGGEDDMITRW